MNALYYFRASNSWMRQENGVFYAACSRDKIELAATTTTKYSNQELVNMTIKLDVYDKYEYQTDPFKELPELFI